MTNETKQSAGIVLEVPNHWVFQERCGCIYGVLRADQRFPGFPEKVVATADQAWDEFYTGEKRRGRQHKKDGNTVKGENEVPALPWACLEHEGAAPTEAKRAPDVTVADPADEVMR